MEPKRSEKRPGADVDIDDIEDPILRSKFINLHNYLYRNKSPQYTPVVLLTENQIREIQKYSPTYNAWNVVTSRTDRGYIQFAFPTSRHGIDRRPESVPKDLQYRAPCWAYCATEAEKSCDPVPFELDNAIYSEAQYLHKDSWETKVKNNVFVIDKIDGSRFKQHDKKHPENVRLVIRYDSDEIKRIIIQDEILTIFSEDLLTDRLFQPYLKYIAQNIDYYDAQVREGKLISDKYGGVLEQEDHFNTEYGFPNAEEWTDLLVQIADHRDSRFHVGTITMTF
jgi:hypothetical protein